MFGVSYWNDGLDAGQWISILGSVVTLVGVGVAAYLSHQYAVRQGTLTHNTAIRTDRLRREIAALEDIWALLAYMSDKKSDKAIIHWQKDRKAGGETVYFFHFNNLEQFCLREVSEVFYQHHAGLFIAPAIRDLLYDYRTVAMGFYFAHKDDAAIPDNGLIKINKPEQAEKLKKIYDDLNRALRAELDERYKALSA